MSYFDTFQEALETNGYATGRPKQEEVFDTIRAGHHLILKAPTGWGKTFAVTAALSEGHAIYSLPLRVLVNTLAEATQNSVNYGVALQHGKRREHARLDKGENPAEPIDLVFTTLDQSLSAFVGIPVGVRYGQANTLPAIIDSSHLIFDEFHLFEGERSMTTAIRAIRASRQNCVILTATLTECMMSFLQEELSRPFGSDHPERDTKIIEAPRPFVNRKTVHIGRGVDDISSIVLGKRTLIIVNSIGRAKDVQRLLKGHYPDLTIDLLHSELLPKDRAAIEKRVVQAFSAEATATAVQKRVLISTQVVEAGVDITSDVLHTELCPPSSFIQRIGRTARYAGERSDIYWHDVTEENLGVYKDASSRITNLREYLTDKGEFLLAESEENEIIELRADSDRQFIEQYKRNARGFDQQSLNRYRIGRDYANYKYLIRDINSRSVAIGTDPDLRYEFLSMSPGKLMGKKAYGDFPKKFYRYNSDTKSVVEIQPPTGGKFDDFLFDFALFDPQQMSYDPEVGLLPGDSYKRDDFVIRQSGAPLVKYQYKLEPYEAHIRYLHQKRDHISWMIDEMARLPCLQRIKPKDAHGLASYLLDFVIWSHDLGKLDYQWQQAHGVGRKGVPRYDVALEHINFHDQLVDQAYPIAHSDGREGAKYNRQSGAQVPSHAWISAWAVKPILDTWNNEKLAKPVLFAIAEHHGYLHSFNSGELSMDRFQPYHLGYLDYLKAITGLEPWRKFARYLPLLNTKIDADECEEAHNFFGYEGPKTYDYIELYSYLSYLLRRCDQLATSEVSETIHL